MKISQDKDRFLEVIIWAALALFFVYALFGCAPRPVNLPEYEVKHSKKFFRMSDSIYGSKNFIYVQYGHTFKPIIKPHEKKSSLDTSNTYFTIR